MSNNFFIDYIYRAMKIIEVVDPILDVPDFTENIPKHKAVVMVYMMKSCPHCEMLKPKWEIVKKIMQADRKFNDVMIADIDSSASSMLPLPPVMGFPNIKVLNGDKLTEYNGIREVDPLLSFIRKTVTSPRKHTARKTVTSPRKHTARKHSGRRSTRRNTKHTARKHSARRSKTRRSTARKHTARNYSATRI